MKGRMSLRCLVVEDDAASREFARGTLAPFATVDTARTLADAGALCAEHRYGLLLLDVALPDGQGDAWLARQRALGNRAPAVALTAELDADRRRRLIASGFVEALGKPLAEDALRRALAPWIGERSAPWDDAQALSALGGARETLQRMRRLFIEELPLQRAQAARALAEGDREALKAVLHKMRAGCGFVGATALSNAVETLHADPDDAAAAQVLLRRIDDALDAGP
jgi:CheY-like chemotaxis protein